jgi:hypothetical protein
MDGSMRDNTTGCAASYLAKGIHRARSNSPIRSQQYLSDPPGQGSRDLHKLGDQPELEIAD